MGAEPPVPALEVMAERLSIVRLPARAALPAWLGGGSWCSVTRTGEELSVVCEAGLVPAGERSNGPWRALKVAGPLDFALTGILSRIAAPLAEAGISVFAVSTFDTDYVLIREDDVQRAVSSLRAAGLVVHAPD